jgi:site-specific DNA recombinase
MEDKLKVSLYIRVSSSRQANDGDSLEEQEKELKKFCEYKNYLIHRTHIERGRSAKNTNRPEYQKLLEDVQAKRINAVVVKKLDRLSRSLLDFEAFMLTAQKHEVEFISLKESFDTTGAMGKAMLRVALVFAQLEREQTSERVKDVMTFRAESGYHNGGKPAYGYDSINKELVPHRQEKKNLELIFTKFLENKSTVQTAKLLNDAGIRNRHGKLWDCRRILHILKNPLYIGQVTWNGKQFAGLHQPIIAENIFKQTQVVFQKKGRDLFSETYTQSILKGLLLCGECGSTMTTSFSLNHSKQKYFYYRCARTTNTPSKSNKSCRVRSLAFKTIEDRVIDLLISLAKEEKFKLIENKILKHNQEVEKGTQGIKADILALGNKLGSIQLNKDRYLDSLIASQFLSSERKKITDKLEALELEEKQTKAELYKQELALNQRSYDQIPLTEFKQALVTLRRDYQELAKDQLHQHLNKTIKEIVYFSDRLKLTFHLLPWPLEFENENPSHKER